MPSSYINNLFQYPFFELRTNADEIKEGDLSYMPSLFAHITMPGFNLLSISDMLFVRTAQSSQINT
jgi:hypothetical protein